MAAKKATKGKKAMTQAQYVEAVAKEWGVPKAEAKHRLDQMNKVTAAGLKKHGKVATNLGSMSVKNVPAKKGGEKMFMPALGREIITKDKPASKKVKLSIGKKFKELF